MKSILSMFRPQPATPAAPQAAPLCDPHAALEACREGYNLTTRIPYGMYMIDIDPVREVGFYQHAVLAQGGKFWLAGATLVGWEGQLPHHVRLGLQRAAITVH